MKKGFTVIELIFIIIIFGIVGVLFFFQKQDVDAITFDTQSKTAINAMYYNLEEVFYSEYGYYPEEINEENLLAMDPQLFTDPNGNNLGTSGSTYRYDSTDCKNGKCKSYTLFAELKKENEYSKSSRNN